MLRLFRSLIGAAILLGTAIAADLPPPDKLPTNKEFPDPLVLLDGTKVTDAKTWAEKRKPELRELFQHYMYGRYPTVQTKISANVLHKDEKAFGGTGTLMEVEVSLGVEKCPPFYVLLAIPNQRTKEGAPVFVGLNFTGNQSIVDDPKIRIPTCWMYDRPGVKGNKATEETRGKNTKVWPLADILKAGYAVATVYSGDFDPDQKELREGMRPVITPPPAGKRPGDETATIMFWAWGVHRIVDYVCTVPEIDAKRIAVVGHSRLGKTALLAGALDERIRVTIPHQAGCGGTAPNRMDNPKAESVKRINTSFPHWFCPNFKSFNDDTAKLPFDQHCLLAMCAPRAVLYSNATEDEWANPSGQFEMLKRASPVWDVLGTKGLDAEKMPEVGKLVDSKLGYWIRAGKHEMNSADWEIFLKFAEKWMK